MAGTPGPRTPAWLNLAIDYGPVLVFFLAYRWVRPAGGAGAAIGEVLAVTTSTLAFIAATLVALVVSKWALGRVSPMLWLTSVLVVGFGLLTVWSQDAFWIRHKPTAVYLIFAVLLLGGWLRGRALLRILLESAFQGLSPRGWLVLSRNCGLFFLALAALNEVLANDAWFSFETWLKAKLFVFLPLSFVFTLLHVPMLLRHGMTVSDAREAAGETPHE